MPDIKNEIKSGTPLVEAADSTVETVRSALSQSLVDAVRQSLTSGPGSELPDAVRDELSKHLETNLTQAVSAMKVLTQEDTRK